MRKQVRQEVVEELRRDQLSVSYLPLATTVGIPSPLRKTCTCIYAWVVLPVPNFRWMELAEPRWAAEAQADCCLPATLPRVYKPILNKLGQCKCKLASYPGCSKKINRCKCRSKTTPKRMYLNGEGCPECCCEDQGRNQCTTTSTTTVTTKVTTTAAASTTALDVEVPTLTCTITAVAASSPTFTFAENVTFKVEASDNSDAVDVVCFPPNGVNRFEVGRTDIVCNATDPAGNFASCSFQVMITDPRSPACAGATTGDSCAIGSLQDSVIPNPSFEERSGCPSGFGQGGQNDGLGFANDWVQATTATSDYFNGGRCTSNSV